MNIYEKIVGTRLSTIVLLCLVAVIGICAYYYFTETVSVKFGALLGGVLASLIGVVIQFLLGWNEHKEVERLKRMGFLDILKNRKGKKEYHSNLLEDARKQIDFVGSTAYSFVYDFSADYEFAGKNECQIITAIDKGVVVRFLLTKEEKLTENKKIDLKRAIERINQLKKDAENKKGSINYKFLENPPPFTFVRVDDKCVFVPKFPSVSSDVSPAILADSNSSFLKQYLTFFEDKWRAG